MTDPPQPADPTDHHYNQVAGLLCLEFLNTVDGWERDPDHPTAYTEGPDEMPTYAHLLAWARQSGAVPGPVADALRAAADRRPDDAERVMARARRFRSAFHGLLGAAMHAVPPDPADIASLNAEAVALLAASRLVPAGEAYRLERPGEGDDAADDPDAPLDRPLWPVVRSALALLTTPEDLARVGECASERCGWVFLDRTGRRRWCSMASCGTTAKVRRFRAKHRSGDGEGEFRPVGE